MTPIFVLIIIALVVVVFAWYKRPIKKADLPANYKNILSEHVAFYRALDDKGKIRFEEKIKEFLGYIRITGVNTNVEDVDKLLVASSGVIPIFGFPEWRYYNLREVLLYPGPFNEISFLSGDTDRHVLGMVGDGAMQRIMILSKPALRNGFANVPGQGNTGIHEFVHLLDKEDGAVDGLPEALLKRQFTIPWLQLIAKNISAIKAGNSDINIYGSKNEAEFFAVASEYFFEEPEKFKQIHPELYNLMTEIFQQSPAHQNTQ
ncbi:peptidase [Niastella vici]|uniref:Peptidase n=1 Tax=Niastella vici TaxID=1703345 RepID=A0A1V9FM35_9BACT|nr:M90 family metallopeptidase [Niastella vici]OQP59415.1 peptidase [Niastella vici]